MKPMPFDYARAKDVPDALAALADADAGARVMAGGQSLVPMLNLRLATFPRVVDISKIAELRERSESADAVTLGACVTHGEIEDGEAPEPAAGLMRHVAAGIAYRAVRNRGTIGGSASLADASADWVTTLLALGARFIGRGPDGEREIAAPDMFLGPYFTAMTDQELLVRIVVPKTSRDATWGYYKVTRRSGEYGLSIGAVILDPAREHASVVLGAASRTPLACTAAAAALRGAPRWTEALETALRTAIAEDLARAERPFEPHEAIMVETTILRAAAQALGVS
ncbi:FAD binding domain-containing protein [Rhodoplanes roseus]|uniref:FAD-binding PCMH-type domain-containing protein n=1 Tax=Rhodoplanes roseus TaxID=29409 RepID=A0A327KYD0_9BRAD|nr:FAD binding domain-containing protein [Rhodoplanes roseus]RAI42763.1 hypothetical protein CH341_17780 [Rhodoplanes roseus]